MHRRGNSMASPFPPHVCDYLFPSPYTLVDRNGVYIQPLTTTRSLTTVLREIEGQRRRSLIPVSHIERPAEPSTLLVQPPSPTQFQPQILKTQISQQVKYDLQAENDQQETEDVGKPLVPSQRLLAFLHSRSDVPIRKPVGRVRLPPFPFTIPRNGMHRSAVSSRVTSPLLPKLANRPGLRKNESQWSSVTYRGVDK